MAKLHPGHIILAIVSACTIINGAATNRSVTGGDVGRQEDHLVNQAIQREKGQEEDQLLLHRNARWADRLTKYSPEFFPNSANLPQRPKFLWIGCSDSRVPETEIIDGVPGEIFVHRNIGGIVAEQGDDANLNAVLEYAISELNVTRILVVGHYRCGAVHGAMKMASDHPNPPHHEEPGGGYYRSTHATTTGWVSNWIRPIRELYQRVRPSLDKLPEPERWDGLVQLQTLANRRALQRYPVVAQRYPNITVHAWIYNVATGHLHDLDRQNHPPSPPSWDDQAI